MKLFITGGAGFIGSNFIRYILNKHPSYKIVNFDKLTYAGNLQNLKDVERSNNYKFIKGDICYAPLVNKSLKGSDYLINFAAETHVDRSIKDSSVFIQTNVLGVRVLLEAARKNKIKRFIQISTDEVYGSIGKGSFVEDSPLKPNSPYSASKAASDLLVRSYVVTYGLPAIVVRSSNNFGPYQFPEKVIPLFISNILEGKKVPLYSKGENIRDWLFVKDNCAAIKLVLEKGQVGGIYNIGAGNELTNFELTQKILMLMGKSEKSINFVQDRPGHDFRYSINANKIKKLGWKPGNSFLEALNDTIVWYKGNKDWWQPLKRKSQ